MGCAALLYGRFADVVELRSNLKKRSYMGFGEMQVVYSRTVRNGISRLRNVQITAVQSCKIVDFLMLRNRVFKLTNVQICIVTSY